MPSFMQKFWERWKEWGLPAFVSALTPLFSHFIDLELISAFYQPALGVAAMVLGALSAMVSFALLADRAREIQAARLMIAIGVLAVTLAICLIFTGTVGKTWFLDQSGRTAIHGIWIVAYVCIFVSLGSAIAIAYLLVLDKFK